MKANGDWEKPIKTRGTVGWVDRHSQRVIDSFSLLERNGEMHMSPKKDKKEHRHVMRSDCWCDPVPGIAPNFWVHQFAPLSRETQRSSRAASSNCDASEYKNDNDGSYSMKASTIGAPNIRTF